MDDFFKNGGWGMYPVLVFGFCLLAAAALHALRPDPKLGRLGLLFAGLTFCAGLLGTAIGIGKSARGLDELPANQQLSIFAEGLRESLNVVVLALIVLVVAGLLGVVGTMRGRRAAVAAV